jgi:hypothetical protein
MTTERKIDATLAALLALDVTLTVVAFFFPGLWFALFHGVPYADPEGFLRRCGANWAGFALFQAIALRRWRRAPWWLAVAAGLRLSDIFTDWTYLAFAHDLTWFGRISLAATSPMNLVVGLYLLRCYRARVC